MAFTLGETISKELVDKLKQKYPNQLPSTIVEKEQLAYTLGQQSVVNYIEDLYNNHVSSRST